MARRSIRSAVGGGLIVPARAAEIAPAASDPLRKCRREST
jgi:hypothetical protein